MRLQHREAATLVRLLESAERTRTPLSGHRSRRWGRRPSQWRLHKATKQCSWVSTHQMVCFCDICHNVMALHVGQDSQPELRCGTCRHTHTVADPAALALSNGVVAGSRVQQPTCQRYLHLDMALSRMRNLACSNPACGARDVSFVKYDADNLRFLFVCNMCGRAWT